MKGQTLEGAIQGLQPIYSDGTKQVAGEWYGNRGEDLHELLAKPGYAVGAVRARAGMVVNAVQLVFYRIDKVQNKLDVSDQYESEWVGCKGGRPYRMDGKGSLLRGIHGSAHRDIISLGIRGAASF